MAINTSTRPAPKARATSPVCALCGRESGSRVQRLVAHGISYNYERHATNRILVEGWFAERFERPDLAGQRICSACWQILYHEAVEAGRL